MTPTSLDFSQRHDLALHAAIVADVQAAASPLGISALIVGAFARDLHLVYGYGIDTQRQTEDLDFAFAVSDWAALAALQERLIDSGAFTAPTSAAHRLRHRGGLPIDIVPFGSVETRDRRIAWPPRGEVVIGIGLVTGMLLEQGSPITPARLPAEMLPDDPDRARLLLEAMLTGLSGTWRR